MSETAEHPGQLDLAGVVAQIERQQAEARKLMQEASKRQAERERLSAEARKLERGWRYAPWLLFVAAVGAIGGFITGMLRILMQGCVL